MLLNQNQIKLPGSNQADKKLVLINIGFHNFTSL